MDKEYGQKAPTLPDGTTLLKEVSLSEEHTEQIKSDRSAIQEAMKRTFKSSVALLFVYGVVNVSGYVILIQFIFHEAMRTPFFALLSATLIIGSMVLKRHIAKGRERLSLRMLEITKASKAAAALIPLYQRYMPGETGAAQYAYMRLVMDNDAELGSSKEYRVRLDTTNGSSYVVREIIVPKAA